MPVIPEELFCRPAVRRIRQQLGLSQNPKIAEGLSISPTIIN